MTLKNVSDWSAKMRLLLEDHKLRSEMSLEALEWSKNFSWQKSADQFIRFITQDLIRAESKQVVKPVFALEGRMR